MNSEPSILVELHRTAVESADRLSARRAGANAYFLTLLTALTGLAPTLPLTWTGAALLWAGAQLMCLLWWWQLRTYRQISRGRFDGILALEAQLPTAVFRDEWAARPRRYLELGAAERVVPCAFALLQTVSVVLTLAA
ncbi:hypothetical protein ABZZ36_29865 [Actinacidiphila glaucinigra]|uniref:RipA family octameric membrane protein n=1 Tax=Actinacidiphila glaucinigra TaxID=235986 RepID=UPI0033BC19F7